MKKLCLVTYTRKGEKFTKELHEIAFALNKYMKSDFKVAICCEENLKFNYEGYEVEFYNYDGTKYSRLVNLMEKDDSQYYFSIDNDIFGNIKQMKLFIHNMINGNYDIGWGKIQANKPKGFISKLVAIDKLLSHNIIRPILWNLGVGISVPGQIFCIKSESYRKKMLDVDTFLDDLALGLYTNITKKNRYVVSDILGYEQPNNKFKGLWKQRERWAIGYASILKGTYNNRDYKWKVLIHGLSYHFLWILNWFFIGIIASKSILLAIIYLILIGILIVKNNIKLLLYSLYYQVIFPLFHIKWICTLLRQLLKRKE